MKIGINCFKDTEIRSMIQTEKKFGNCDISSLKDVLIYDTDVDEYLEDYFSEIVDVYTSENYLPDDFPEEYKDSLSNFLYNDWNIFNVTLDKISLIIPKLCKGIYKEDSAIFTQKVGILSLCNTSYLEENCLIRNNKWEDFKSSIKNVNRFHSNHINLKLLEKLLKSDTMHVIYDPRVDNLELCRGRIGKFSNMDDLLPPPPSVATAGRANSKGISCLYLANDISTTLHEIRARDLDIITVGTFCLKKKIDLVDLSNLEYISPFMSNDFDAEWFAINMGVLKKINEEIAKPLRRQDSEIDYLPTQYISDFVKSLGFDGIKYKSTLNPKGTNYAIFNKKKFICREIKWYTIDSINYNCREI
jgi:hypothetical protein